MARIVIISICVLLLVALAAPAFSNGKGSVAGKAYARGVSAVETVETAFSGCLKSVFSLCNPCLDLVKGCANVALIPIEAPFNLISGKPALGGPPRAQAPKVPIPKKPEMPKKPESGA